MTTLYFCLSDMMIIGCIWYIHTLPWWKVLNQFRKLIFSGIWFTVPNSQNRSDLHTTHQGHSIMNCLGIWFQFIVCSVIWYIDGFLDIRELGVRLEANKGYAYLQRQPSIDHIFCLLFPLYLDDRDQVVPLTLLFLGKYCLH